MVWGDMLSFPNINPVVFSLGSYSLHWYAVMYILGFGAAWLLGRYRAKQTDSEWTRQTFDELLTFAMLGVLIGSRLGYVLFYDFTAFSANPLLVFKLWQGGMSFHGGVLGFLAAVLWWSRKNHRAFWSVTDFLVPLVPLGLFFGRIGNFINAELWGKVTTVPWGMVFPNGGSLPRHPSQLYEAGLEGLALFIVLWIFTDKQRPIGAATGLFAVGYSMCRIFVEFFRLPDQQLGYLAFGFLTMGQLLSLPMLLAGLWLLLHAHGSHSTPAPGSTRSKRKN